MVTRKTPASLDAILSGQKIHGRILQSGYSIKEIQNMLGLECPQSVYRWLKGRSMPSIDNLYMLSQILDVHMEDLLVSMVPQIIPSKARHPFSDTAPQKNARGKLCAIRGHCHYQNRILHSRCMVKRNPAIPFILAGFQQPPL